MRKVGTSIVGCGGIARVHAKALSQLEESQLIAVCDVIEERARAFAQTYGAKRWYTDYRMLIADPEVEAVNVCTPHPLHAAPVVAAAEAGKHAITEKPMAANLKQADAMISAARRAGVKLGVIFQRRWYDAARRMKQAIEEGKIGTPILGEVSCRFSREKAYYDRDPWRGKWSTEGGGVYMNQIVHEIDLLQWFMSSPVDSLTAFTANLTHPYIEVEDNAVTALRFKSGGLAVISATVSAYPPDEDRITVTGSNGPILGIRGLDPFWTEPWTIRGEEKQAEEWRKAQLAVRDRPDFWGEQHKAQVQDWLQAILEDREPAVTGEEGRKALEIIVASYISSAQGKTVKFPVREDHPYHTAGP
ncbi:MAG: Gfo/Idh/MocA family oxidoreductase [Candidatus Bathyarchaeia archaeon]